MGYQDKWLRGKVIQKGYRDCADRYEIIRSFCAGYRRPFTACDIGANWCYFGLRLTEDFQDCTMVAFEYDNFKLRMEHLKANKARRVILLNRKLSLEDLCLLRPCFHFDLILALSVLHHTKGETDSWIDGMRHLADSVIVEFAMKDSRRMKARECSIPDGGKLLGLGASHLDEDILRPIVLFSGWGL